ncbi:MAG: DUF2478 domain-containing protein [Burkholderiaceae bacterium]
MSDTPSTVAAVLADGSADTDALLADVAREQRERGRRVCGLLMKVRGGSKDCAREMVLQDIRTGDDYLVSQPLGSDSTACRADPQGFARASNVLRAALGQAPELVICNRFGQLEADGAGFRAELLELMAQGVPLLTAVATRHREAWQAFTGGAQVLPARPDALARWLEQVLVPAAATR